MSPFRRQALLYEPLDSNSLQCKTCERRCTIQAGQYGFCRTRTVYNQKLFTLLYGNISSISNNPIEKKPFHHFFPGTRALTVGSWGCNFSCPFCQNWQISKSQPLDLPNNYLSVEAFAQLLETYKSQGTSFSFNEPTLLLEYALDVMNSLNPLQYYHTYVTNMYMSKEALDLLIKGGCHAYCVNVKGDALFYEKYCSVDVEIVWRNLRAAKE